MRWLSCHATFWASVRTSQRTCHVSFCTVFPVYAQRVVATPVAVDQCRLAVAADPNSPLCRRAASAWPTRSPRFIRALSSASHIATSTHLVLLALHNSVRETRILFPSRPNFQYWDPQVSYIWGERFGCQPSYRISWLRFSGVPESYWLNVRVVFSDTYCPISAYDQWRPIATDIQTHLNLCSWNNFIKHESASGTRMDQKISLQSKFSVFFFLLFDFWLQ